MTDTKQTIQRLVETFGRNLDTYKHSYNEAMVRREFIDPCFEALGWDVSNKAGYAEAYKDVIHEDAIKIGGATKAPDYAFRIGGTKKFFVEAKKPAVDIKGDIHPAYQLRRYAWSAKLPLSILTDFEEFAVYDCRIKPVQTDQAATARIMYLAFEDYPDRWDEIAAIFAKEEVLKGSFDRYVEATKRKRGTAEVDSIFLKEIEVWRELLARNIAIRNNALSQREVNFAVARTIDRIIFLRICEDRGMEDYGQLMSLLNGTNAYKRLVSLYRRADEKYNSGLFHFRLEKDRHEPPDELTPRLVVDDKILKDILKQLYYPDSPYEFSVLPADILGHIYEQFLGQVIRLTPGHRAKVEAKPEVRKAGGVYYTPTYIVDYIVKNTVGKLLEKKTPRSAAKLKILDPACGSGSFLIGAYQYLLDWHRDWYVANDPEKWAQKKAPAIYRAGVNDWRLTTVKRKEILLNNIYGVDIDPQAVEVTKLSLLLKVLEGESSETINRQRKLFHERALPDLGNNVKCGNSLIGPDFYDGEQISLLDEDEQYRINAFDWEAEFPEVFYQQATKGQRGRRSDSVDGFDAVIGNPPYIRIQAMKEWAPIEVEEYKRRYISAKKGNYDIYVVFVEKSISLLNNNGLLGFILPHKFFNAKYGELLRNLISSGEHLQEIIHFGDKQIFRGATNYTCILILKQGKSKEFRFVKVEDLVNWYMGKEQLEGYVPATKASSSPWNFVVGKSANLFERLNEEPMRLGNFSRIFQGLVTGADRIFVLEAITSEIGGIIKVKASDDSIYEMESKILKPFLNDFTVSTFQRPKASHWLLFPYCLINGKMELITSKDFSEKYPQCWHYLNRHSAELRDRERGKWHHSSWYAFGRSQNLIQMEESKLIVQVVSKCGRYTYDDKGIYFTGGGNGPYYGIRPYSNFLPHSIHYLQAILGSSLLDFMLHKISTTFRGGYWSYSKRFIEQLPIRQIDFSDKKDKSRYDKMVKLVDRMLDLHKRLNKAKTPHDREVLQRQINATDRQIDKLVYELYDLTEEEIRIVERSL